VRPPPGQVLPPRCQPARRMVLVGDRYPVDRLRFDLGCILSYGILRALLRNLRDGVLRALLRNLSYGILRALLRNLCCGILRALLLNCLALDRRRWRRFDGRRACGDRRDGTGLNRMQRRCPICPVQGTACQKGRDHNSKSRAQSSDDQGLQLRSGSGPGAGKLSVSVRSPVAMNSLVSFCHWGSILYGARMNCVPCESYHWMSLAKNRQSAKRVIAELDTLPIPKREEVSSGTVAPGSGEGLGVHYPPRLE